MRHTVGRDNLCSWLLNTGVLTAWRRHRPTRHKTVTVNDTWLRTRSCSRKSPRDSRVSCSRMMSCRLCSRTIRLAPGSRLAGVYGLNVTDRSTIHTAEAQTLPRKIVRGAVEIVMHFQSTASFTSHGRTPLVDCEMTRLANESSTYRWSKHKHCHAYRLNETVENSASPAYRSVEDSRCRMGQLVPIYPLRIASHPHIDNATHNLDRDRLAKPHGAYGSIAGEDRGYGGPLPSEG